MEYLQKIIKPILNFLILRFIQSWKSVKQFEGVRSIFVFSILTSLFVSITLSILGAYILSKFLGIKINYTNNILTFDERYPRYLQQRLIQVEPSLGWQGYKIKVKKDDVIRLKIEGRVHCGAGQINNFFNVLKPAIVNFADSNSSLKNFTSYVYNKEQSKDLIFRRRWSGPEGDKVVDEMLDPAKLFEKADYGQLLVAVFPNEDDLNSIQFDPIDIIQRMKIDKDIDIFLANETHEINISKDGYLVFIVNDAIVSNNTLASERSRELYKALVKYHEYINEQHLNSQRFEKSEIPQIFYSDNIGKFTVLIENVNN